MDTLACNTETCSLYQIQFQVENNGTKVTCSGECNNVLRPENPDHPSYPESPDNSPSPEELMDDRLRHWGLIPLE